MSTVFWLHFSALFSLGDLQRCLVYGVDRLHWLSNPCDLQHVASDALALIHCGFHYFVSRFLYFSCH